MQVDSTMLCTFLFPLILKTQFTRDVQKSPIEEIDLQ